MYSTDRKVVVLCARKDSHYKNMSNVECYDSERNAFSYYGNEPIVAHPPCRLWGRYKHRAKSENVELEKHLARFCVNQVRNNGGVLEHPDGSSLFKEMDIPVDGSVDMFGGYVVKLNQGDYGHRAEKRTFLYVVRCVIPYRPPYKHPNPKCVEKLSVRQREMTPEYFGRYLVDIARTTKR